MVCLEEMCLLNNVKRLQRLLDLSLATEIYCTRSQCTGGNDLSHYKIYKKSHNYQQYCQQSQGNENRGKDDLVTKEKVSRNPPGNQQRK